MTRLKEMSIYVSCGLNIDGPSRIRGMYTSATTMLLDTRLSTNASDLARNYETYPAQKWYLAATEALCTAWGAAIGGRDLFQILVASMRKLCHVKWLGKAVLSTVRSCWEIDK